MEKWLIEQLLQLIPQGTWLWITWWIAMYLNKIRHWAKFSFFIFCINIFLAGWIGWLVFTILPDTAILKVQITSISWFLSYPILDLLEKKWLTLLINKYLWKK